MQFAFLTHPEAESANIDWYDDVDKESEIVTAATAAGFSSDEVAKSPLGYLANDFCSGAGMTFHKGARALVGMNGSTLIEITAS